MKVRGEICYGDELNPLAESEYQKSVKTEKIKTCEIGKFQDEHEIEKNAM